MSTILQNFTKNLLKSSQIPQNWPQRHQKTNKKIKFSQKFSSSESQQSKNLNEKFTKNFNFQKKFTSSAACAVTCKQLELQRARMQHEALISSTHVQSLSNIHKFPSKKCPSDKPKIGKSKTFFSTIFLSFSLTQQLQVKLVQKNSVKKVFFEFFKF